MQAAHLFPGLLMTRTIFLMPILVLAALTPLQAAAQEETPASLSGIVRSSAAAAKSGGVLENALVTIRVGPTLGTTYTDRNGRYEFSSLLPGPYELAAGKAAYNSQFRSIELEPGQAGELDFDLSWGDPERGSLEVVVSDRRGSALGGARVTIVQPSVPQPERETDPRGYAFFPGLEAGDYSLTVERAGFKPATLRRVTARAGRPTRVSAVLRPDPRQSGRIEGIVRDEFGAPLRRAEVAIAAGISPGVARTDSAGRYRLTRLVPDAGYAVSASAPGHQTVSQGSVQVTALQATVLDFVLPARSPETGSIVGRIRDRRGGALPFATVSISSGPAFGREVQADVEGRYVIDRLEPAGNYGVLAEAPGFYAGGRTGLAVFAGEALQVNLDLQPVSDLPGRLGGIVLDDETGQPLPGVLVEIVEGPISGVGTVTRSGGEWILRDLPPAGNYTVRISSDSFQVFQQSGVQVRAGQQTDLDVRLQRRLVGEGAVGGVVKKPNGRTLAGARVRLFRADNRIAETTTSTTGAYLFSGVRPGGGYRVRVEAEKFATESRDGLVVTEGETLAVDFVLRKAAAVGGIAGQVLDLLLQPVAGATVVVLEGPERPAPVSTDAQGRFAFPDLPGGVYTLEVRAAGFRNTRRDGITVTTDRTTSVTIQMLR